MSVACVSFGAVALDRRVLGPEVDAQLEGCALLERVHDPVSYRWLLALLHMQTHASSLSKP